MMLQFTLLEVGIALYHKLFEHAVWQFSPTGNPCFSKGPSLQKW
jgi:hypothetical protein